MMKCTFIKSNRIGALPWLQALFHWNHPSDAAFSELHTSIFLKINPAYNYFNFFLLIVEKFTLLDGVPDPYIKCRCVSGRENDWVSMRLRLRICCPRFYFLITPIQQFFCVILDWQVNEQRMRSITHTRRGASIEKVRKSFFCASSVK